LLQNVSPRADEIGILPIDIDDFSATTDILPKSPLPASEKENAADNHNGVM
jgi:hypothetical protein